VQSNAICRNAPPICEGVAADMLAVYDGGRSNVASIVFSAS